MAKIWCQAAESENITEDPLQSDVYARSRYSKAWIEVPVSQGEAVAALPDGTLIKAENAPEHAAVFKVILIDPSERDAWAWIKSCLGDKAELHQAYDLSFEDDEGERMSIDLLQMMTRLRVRFIRLGSKAMRQNWKAILRTRRFAFEGMIIDTTR